MRGADCTHIDSAVIDHLRAAVRGHRHIVGFINVDGAVVNGFTAAIIFRGSNLPVNDAGGTVVQRVSISSSRDIGIAVYRPPVIEGAGPQAVIRQRHHTIFEVIKRPAFIDRAVFNHAGVIDGCSGGKGQFINLAACVVVQYRTARCASPGCHRTGIVHGTGPLLNRVHGTAVVNNGTCYRGAGFPGDGTSIVEDAAVYGNGGRCAVVGVDTPCLNTYTADTASGFVGDIAVIFNDNLAAADGSRIANVYGFCCNRIGEDGFTGQRFTLGGNLITISKGKGYIAISWVVLVTVLASAVIANGAVVNYGATAVGQEGLAVIGINIDDTAGVVDDGAAVERRHADQLVCLAFNAVIGGQGDYALVNGGSAVKRHHAEPGVVNGNGASVDSGGVAIGIGRPRHHS